MERAASPLAGLVFFLAREFSRCRTRALESCTTEFRLWRFSSRQPTVQHNNIRMLPHRGGFRQGTGLFLITTFAFSPQTRFQRDRNDYFGPHGLQGVNIVRTLHSLPVHRFVRPKMTFGAIYPSALWCSAVVIAAAAAAAAQGSKTLLHPSHGATRPFWIGSVHYLRA